MFKHRTFLYTNLHLGLLIGLRKLVELQPGGQKTSSQRASIKSHVFIIKISKIQDTDLHKNLPGTLHSFSTYDVSVATMGTRFGSLR